jgi:hypothetical protein
MKQLKKKSSKHKLRINHIKQNLILNSGYQKLNKIEKNILFSILNSDKEITSKQFDYLKKVIDKYFSYTVEGIKYVAPGNEHICKQKITSKNYRKNKAIAKQFNN